MKFSLRIDGGERLARELTARHVTRAQARDALRVGAVPMKSAIEAHAPHAPGAPDIRSNIVVSAARPRERGDVAIAVGPSKATRDDGGVHYDFQGVLLEFGTAKMDQQAFMRPAFDEQARSTLSIVLQRLWGLVSRRGAASGGFGGLD
jgi:HK97 gp10 family phage protein